MKVIDGGFDKKNTKEPEQSAKEVIEEILASWEANTEEYLEGLGVDTFVLIAENKEAGLAVHYSNKESLAEILYSIECYKKIILEVD
jgi:hypothetical protein